MGVRIKNIQIKNFRSIRNVSIDANYLTTLVGKNDSGKSNILRALNLFFNGETNPGQIFDFDGDHNIYNRPNRQAKEISIRLELEIPSAYHDTNGEIIVWEKKWRAGGVFFNEYHGIKIIENRLGNRVRKEIKIPSKSNVHALLSKIEYEYIPAIKDLDFFEVLRSKIYRTISEVAQESFRKSSSSFEDAIGSHLSELTGDILSSIGISTRMALPRDLSHIFEKLDFLSEGDSISLESRGDGIKVRHIPLILKYIVDKKRTLATRGAAPYSFIWGYEEPENNLELASCIQLADQMWEYMYGDVAQILLTTHSPVFYNLEKKNNENEICVMSQHIYRDVASEGTKSIEKPDDLDEKMGTMLLFAPHIKDLEDRVRAQLSALQEAEILANKNKCKVFVEGESDRLVLQRAIDVFAREFSSRIEIETKAIGAGVNYVADMLIAWSCVSKHHPDTPKAIGIVDNDAAGSEAKARFENSVKSTAQYKVIKLPAPTSDRAAIRAGLKVPTTIESFYSEDVWRQAETLGILEPRNMADVLSSELLGEILRNEKELSDVLQPEFEKRANLQFSYDKKVDVALRVSKKDEATFIKNFGETKLIVDKVVSFFFPDE